MLQISFKTFSDISSNLRLLLVGVIGVIRLIYEEQCTIELRIHTFGSVGFYPVALQSRIGSDTSALS